MSLLDREGRVAYTSPSTARLLGRTVEEIVDHGAFEHAHPEDRPRCLEEFAALLEQPGLSLTSRFRCRHPDGSLHWIELTATNLLEESKVEAVAGSYRDVTEAVQAEAALRESEVQLRLFIDHAPAALAMFDRDMRYLAVSRRWMTDYRVGDRSILGRSHYEVFPGPPEDWKAVHRRVLAGEVVRAEEERFVRKDGTELWLRWEMRPWHTADGQIGGMVIFTEDITGQKRAEAERERLHEELRRSEKMAALGSLVGGVAHEVRNPLFGISATIDAFEAKVGRTPEYQPYLDVLRGEITRLKALTEDLMSYGRPVPVTLGAGSVEDVIAAAARDCGRLAEDQRVRVSVQAEEGLPPVPLDRDRLRQVFQNLIQNAVQHAPPDSAVLVAVRQARHEGRGCVECDVVDCGPGFAAEDLPRVFEPFFSCRRGGTGLGLALVQRIVEQHGGTLIAANRSEGGAVVTVRLPVA